MCLQVESVCVLSFNCGQKVVKTWPNIAKVRKVCQDGKNDPILCKMSYNDVR